MKKKKAGKPTKAGKEKGGRSPSRGSVTADKNAIVHRTGTLVKANMLEYGSYVIEDRAVPDFRDGLKPSQRRILYTMRHDLKLSHTGATVKCAKIVGSTLGSYHPHGDSSVYGALVGMYHMRYRLIQPRGNFGNDLEREAAYRYTEAKFSKLQSAIFACADVMEKVPNFDGTTSEPLVINTRLPLLLMNGAEGIAVGLSMAIPSHNLQELTNALKYVVKNFKTVTTEDVMQFVKGPDFRCGGRLVSKPKEILEVYKNGYGPIDVQCEYNVGRDSEGRTTIDVIGYPDEFSVQGFLNACSKLQESGAVHAVEDDYMPSRFGEVGIDGKPLKAHRILVTLSNKKGMDAVLRKLTVRKTYQFYTTQRSEEGIKLKTYNFLDILKNWIRWRKKEETKVLELDKKQAERSLWCEETRLVAMLNVQVIADALKQEKLEFTDYLIKHMKVTKEQAEYIADLKVGNLRKANIGDQKKKIADIKKEIERIVDDLAHISRVVLKHLDGLSPMFDARRTHAAGRAQSTAKLVIEHTGDPVVMLAAKDGKLFTNVNEKGSTTADVMATASYEGAVIFDESGLTQVMSVTECEGKAGPAYKNIVGIAPHETQHLLAIGKNGYAIKMPGAEQQKQSEFQSIKGTTLVAGFGVNPDSQVLVWGKKHGEFLCIKADRIREVRKNTAGAKLVNFKPVRALVVHNNQYLYTDEGSRVAPAKAGDTVEKVKLFVINDRNIVIYKTGRRKFMDRTATVKEIAKDRSGIRFVYPASLPVTSTATEPVVEKPTKTAKVAPKKPSTQKPAKVAPKKKPVKAVKKGKK
jgi:DNA gyrase/topoisomerase IV subunit A